MQTQQQKSSPPKHRSKPRRRLWAAGALLIVAAAAGFAMYFLRSAPALPLDAPPEKIIAFIGSEDFIALPESQQIPYIKEISKLTLPQLILAASSKSLTDEQKRQAFINGRNAWLALHADECFSLPPGPERDAYFEKLAGSMEVRIAAANGGWDRNPHGERLTPQMLKQWIETVPPTRRALAAEFAAELEGRGAFK